MPLNRRKIQRLLIANRGEIALRIMRTARRLGIASIGVYSRVDNNAMHVKACDESVLLGDAPPADSYLNIDKIIEAAVSLQADAIHAGYGFLAENAEFARRCAENDIIFVGPPPDAINLMGLKGLAREKMIEADVPVLPGIDHVNGDDVAALVDNIGYPVMIKPEAGGGGKGMKIVREPGELTAALETARREALSSFNDDRLMLEKYLDAPRHVEIQVFADSQGHCIHLNERDCSLQRRHQKIIEESPAPGFKPSLREAMGSAAVAAAKAIDYEGAGTVEFLLAPDDTFYFMEMNTRLQVEHPVTEAITGFDLVEWQLRVASGEPLPATQDQVTIRGHAMEARIYAEDPLNDFLPASGQIRYLDLPAESADLRIDNGVATGDLVGVFYDPMLMKLIARGSDRNATVHHLRHGLQQLHLAGITTNRDFLLAILDNETFQNGEVTTNWLDG
ncbi:MAG: biotin carboxylase N-terminal domain-containing protein, partial [Pseudomonadales bacterium]